MATTRCGTNRKDDRRGQRLNECAQCKARAFSIIELLVVIGIVMILLGILLPALARTRDQGEMVRQMSITRQNALLIENYCVQFRNFYPFLSHLSGLGSAQEWWVALQKAGMLDGEAGVPGPEASAIDAPSHMMSWAMASDWTRMRPGHTRPWDPSEPKAIRTTDVRFPSLKGLIVREWIEFGPVQTAWCCLQDAPPAPVAFADMSIEVGAYTDYLPDGRLYIEDGIGAPVIATWYGCKGRDR